MQLAHVLFAVDLKAKPARMYYIDTPRYQLHVRFLRDTRLVPNTIKREIDRNYLVPDRRFLFGTLSWQQNIGTFTYEFWEGDQLTAPLLRQADAQVKASFFAPVKFKTNSTLHERIAKETGIDYVSQEALIREQPFLPMNLGTATGRVRIVDDESGINALLPDDIAVLRQVPISLPPVAGVLTERPSTALSHVNLLAKGWGMPNAYVRDAAAVLKEHAGQWVALKVAASGYQVRRLAADEIAALPPRAVRTAAAGAVPGGARAIKPDLREARLLPLASLRARNSAQCGTKAANLGAMQAARIPGTSVPDGFCVPFAHYDRFMRANGLADRIARMQQQPGFASDPKLRQKALAQLRDEIVQWPVDASTAASWRAAWQSQLGGGGVFVRSSSNSEDLPGFSGAGLYTTVPNVKTGDAHRGRGEEGLGLGLQPRGLGSAQRRGLRRRVGADGRVRPDRHRLDQRRRDDHARPLRRGPPARHVHLGQARHRHPRGRGAARGRAGDVFELVEGHPGAEPLGRGNLAAARQGGRGEGGAGGGRAQRADR